MRELDALDRAIIVELEKDARIPITDLARRLNCPNSTIRDRILKLEQDQIILGYTTILNYKKLGYGVKAIMEVTRDSAVPSEKSFEDIQDIPEVVNIQVVTGEVDELVTIYVRDVDHLKDVIFSKFTSIKQKLKQNTLIVLDEKSFPFAANLLKEK
jgi:Lrp/AsnC family transcriptional regulator, regulator for asnA, asnC and gidA